MHKDISVTIECQGNADTTCTLAQPQEAAIGSPRGIEGARGRNAVPAAQGFALRDWGLETGDWVEARYGYHQTAPGRAQEREEGAVRRTKQTDPEEPAEVDSHGAWEGSVRGEARR